MKINVTQILEQIFKLEEELNFIEKENYSQINKIQDKISELENLLSPPDIKMKSKVIEKMN